MKAILERISSVCGLLDTDGITVHTMNGNYQQDNIRYSVQAADFVRQVREITTVMTHIDNVKKNTGDCPKATVYVYYTIKFFEGKV